MKNERNISLKYEGKVRRKIQRKNTKKNEMF